MQKFWSLAGRKQNSLGSAAFILMLMVVISGLLGLIRYRILYDWFTTDQTGVFFAAFRLPNFLFEMLSMGTLASAFIPVFTKYITRDNDKSAYIMASSVINITVLIMVTIAIPILIWTKEFSRLLAPGFTQVQINDMVSYTRIMLILQVIPLIVGNFFTGILQSYKLFIMPALAPILYNAGMIAGIIILSPVYGMYGAVIGVGIGAFLFLLIHIPLLWHQGYVYKPIMDFKNPGVREIGKLIVPRLIGLGVSQIDVTVDLMLSTVLGSKMVSVFYLAQSLQQLPVRLFGTTVSQAALPTLSTATAAEDLTNFKQSVLSAYNMILFFVIPSSVVFIVLRVPIVRLTFGATMFDWEATVMTAMTLSAFAVSLSAQAVSQVFIRGFYALYNTKTPVIISVITILVNSLLSIYFVIYLHLPVWSLGLSTTVASIINAVLLLWFLNRKVNGFDVSDLLFRPFKMLIASIIMGIIIYIPMKLFDQLVFDTSRVFGLIMLTVITGGLGLVSYLFIAWVFNIGEVKSFLALFKKVSKFRNIFIEPATEIVSGEIKEN
jgi:putative peptidoglycan lipid II flippase